MLKFKCPKCGCEVAVERVQCNGFVSQIDAIYSSSDLEYSQCEADGEVYNVQYECRDCDFVVPDAINQVEFVEWVKSNVAQ